LYTGRGLDCTLGDMDVTVSTLRAHLSEWLERVQAGEEVVVTDRGTPVARILGVSAPGLLDRLAHAGQVGRPKASAPPTPTARSSSPSTWRQKPDDSPGTRRSGALTLSSSQARWQCRTPSSSSPHGTDVCRWPLREAASPSAHEFSDPSAAYLLASNVTEAPI